MGHRLHPRRDTAGAHELGQAGQPPNRVGPVVREAPREIVGRAGTVRLDLRFHVRVEPRELGVPAPTETIA